MGDDKGLICQGVFMYREGHTLTVGIGGMHGDRTILYILVENGFTRGSSFSYHPGNYKSPSSLPCTAPGSQAHPPPPLLGRP